MKKLLKQILLLGAMLSAVTMGAGASEVSVDLTLTPENYFTVSNIAEEKLACAPGMAVYGEGNVAVSYLADEINTVETESSTTIVCRLGLFEIDSPEEGSFIDIASAGETVGDITIGDYAPYEPNLLKLSDEELLIYFNVRDINGSYVYYSARFDTFTRTVISYEPLTLDGKRWTPANIAASYKEVSGTDIGSAGPAGSMVFTSKIIWHDGYYYGYCGGICSKFSGILVRSTDGINWTSVMAPEAADDMCGVIECGFQILNDTVYFCMRDISSGMYHCSYRFSDGQQLVKTVKIQGLTTSKPAAFIQNDTMYVIVNKATGDDATVGRRNTALFYEVDPERCELVLVKRVFCADGCAYHTVEEWNGTNYWCFHTDARRIDPYTQGRSNLAFLQIPPLERVKVTDEEGIIDFDRCMQLYEQGCITAATNKWQAGAVNTHYQIPISSLGESDIITVTANAEKKSYLAFFAEKMEMAGAVAYAEGWTEQLILEAGTSQTLEIPSDAEYLYVLATNAAGDSLLPQRIVCKENTLQEALSLRYDDHHDVSGKTVEIIDAGSPTSYQVGYGVEENTLRDTAVVTLEGDTLVATGIGTAKVRIDGTEYAVTVEPAPISLLLIIGQSNAEGMEGSGNQSVICPDGQVYSTYAKSNGLTGDAGLTVENAGNYVPSALAGEHSTVNINGTDTKLSGYPVNSLTEEGAGKYGMDSGLAYEWAKQTSEKVWVVNAAHGASSITSWQKGKENYD